MTNSNNFISLFSCEIVIVFLSFIKFMYLTFYVSCVSHIIYKQWVETLLQHIDVFMQKMTRIILNTEENEEN